MVVYLLQPFVHPMWVLRLHVKVLLGNVLIQVQLMPLQPVRKNLARTIKFPLPMKIVPPTCRAVEQMGLGA